MGEKQSNEQLYFDALHKVRKFQTSEWLKRNAEKQYGLSYEEALEMAYDNIRVIAEVMLMGKRRPKQ